MKYSAYIFLFTAVSLSAAGVKDRTEQGPVDVTLWTFTDDLKKPIEKFQQENPDIKISLVLFPWDEIATKLRPVLRSGKGAPDLFAVDMADVRTFVEAGYWLNLSDEFEINESAVFDYVLDLGRDNDGDIRALAWQATPGATYYRRNLAKQYFGTDDPQEIAAKFSSPENIIAMARELKEQSGGTVKLLGGRQDYTMFFRSLRKSPWVVDDTFVIDPMMEYTMDFGKTLYDEDLDAKTQLMTPEWFTGIKENTIFLALLPTWGLTYSLKGNVPETAGDWALTSSPAPWYWGGTWMGIYKDSPKKQAAWKFLEALSLNKDFGMWWVEETGDFPANKEIIDELKDTVSDPYLAGQNTFEFFFEEARKIRGDLVTKYDTQLNSAFDRALWEHLEGRMTKDEALQFLKDEVKTAYPELIVE